MVFLGDLPISPHLTIDSAQNEWNNLVEMYTYIYTEIEVSLFIIQINREIYIQ